MKYLVFPSQQPTPKKYKQENIINTLNFKSIFLNENKNPKPVKIKKRSVKTILILSQNE